MNKHTITITRPDARTTRIAIPTGAPGGADVAGEAFDAATRVGASFTMRVRSGVTTVTTVGKAWRPGEDNYVTLPYPGGTYVVGTLPPTNYVAVSCDQCRGVGEVNHGVCEVRCDECDGTGTRYIAGEASGAGCGCDGRLPDATPVMSGWLAPGASAPDRSAHRCYDDRMADTDPNTCSECDWQDLMDYYAGA